MAIQLLKGNGQIDFRRALLQQMVQDQVAHPQMRAFYVVPNHIKFSAEVDVLKTVQTDEQLQMLRPEVYSISRLAWALMSDYPAFSKRQISDVGLQLLVEDALKTTGAFGRQAHQRGFIERLSQQIKELRSSQITEVDLQTVLTELDERQLSLRQKIEQLLQVKQVVDERIAHYDVMLNGDTLALFAQFIAEHDEVIGEATFYLEGFAGFTRAELDVVNQLAQHHQIHIALLGQKQHAQESELFYKTQQTVEQLQRINQVTEKNLVGPLRPLSETAQVLETAWRELETNQVQRSVYPQPEQLTIYRAESREAEIEHIARLIKHAVDSSATNPIRYRDILILGRDLKAYQTIIAPIFKRHGIAHFVDLEDKMQLHPFAELVLSLFDEQTYAYRYEAIMRLLKTGLLLPEGVLKADFQAALDHVENYLLAHHINRDWHQIEFNYLDMTTDDEVIVDQADEQINQQIQLIKQFVQAVLDDAQQFFRRPQTTANRVILSELVDFLHRWHVDEALQSGDESSVLRGQQIWRMFTNLLDEIVLLYGDETSGELGNFDAQRFSELLQAGFSAAAFSGIPAQLDTVQISEAGSTQANHFKLVFYLGATSDALPASTKTKAILNDLDRETLQTNDALQTAGKYLQDTAQQQMASENLLFYQSLLTSKERFVFTYPILDNAGQPLKESLYVDRLRKAIGQVDGELPVEMIYDHPTQLTDLPVYSASARSAISHTLALQQTLNIDVKPQLAPELLASTTHPVMAMQVFKTYTNQVSPLKPAIAQRLFGQQVAVSVSGLEAYYQNPYEYFLRYGLRLKTRNQQTINAALAGSYFHAGLENIFKRSLTDQTDLVQLTPAELNDWVNQATALEQLTDENPTLNVLSEGARNAAILNEYRQTVFKSARQWQSFLQMMGTVQPRYLEKTFGHFADDQTSQALQPLTYGKAGEIKLRGKIDRLDVWTLDEQAQSVLIDYKTKGKKFELKKVYAGLELQLLSYWDAVEKNANELGTPPIQAAFFAPIRQPILKLNDIKNDSQRAQSAQQLLNQEAVTAKPHDKMLGIILNEGNFVENLKAQDQDGDYFALRASDTYLPSELATLKAHTRYLIENASQHILSGQFSISPYRDGEMNGLTYSDYRDVMRIDASLNDPYHDLASHRFEEYDWKEND